MKARAKRALWSIPRCTARPFRNPKMLDRIERAILNNRLIEEGDTVLVAFSGGADSTALLSILNSFKQKLGFNLYAAHYNHSIRLDADEDEAFCRRFSESLGISFFSERGDAVAYASANGLSLETAARELRFDFLYRTSETLGASSVATAHHANDDAESVLMHMIRGSGLAGLTGIKYKSVRRLNAKNRDDKSITLIRPLLEIKKEEILEYLDSIGQEFCEDSTNFELDAARNVMRLKIIPMIEELNPAAIDNILRLKSIAAEDEAYLENAAKEALIDARTQTGFNRVFLNSLPAPILKRCLRLIIDEKASLVDIESKHIESLVSLIKMRSGASVDIPRARARNAFDTLIVEPRSEIKETHVECSIPLEITGETISTSAGDFRLCVIEDPAMEKNEKKVYNYDVCALGNVAFMDLDRLTLPLNVRFRRPGDRFRPVNCAWRMRLKDYFISKKTDRCIRDTIPLVISGEEIVFIPGFVIADGVKLTDKTKRILKIEYLEKTKEN